MSFSLQQEAKALPERVWFTVQLLPPCTLLDRVVVFIAVVIVTIHRACKSSCIVRVGLCSYVGIGLVKLVVHSHCVVTSSPSRRPTNQPAAHLFNLHIYIAQQRDPFGLLEARLRA